MIDYRERAMEKLNRLNIHEMLKDFLRIKIQSCANPKKDCNEILTLAADYNNREEPSVRG